MQEALKVEAFKNAIRDEEVKFKLLLEDYASLAEVVTEAYKIKVAQDQFEAAKAQSCTEKARQLFARRL